MQKMIRSIFLGLAALALAAFPAGAGATAFPDLIQLPTGFQPEGIVVGKGSTFYSGSLANGAIYRGDLRTGQGEIFVPGQAGMVSVGLAFDERSGSLFVAGGPTGLARVYDGGSGALLASYALSGPGSFINDAIVTRDAVFFTNSSLPLLYKLPLGPGGSLPDPASIVTLTLSGGWQQVAGFNANGIEATSNGKDLIVVNSTVGRLFRVDPATGEAQAVDLGGESVSAGDGLLLRGSLLYVVRNRLNEIVVVNLAADLASGRVVERLTNPNFAVPTTIASFGSAVYAVNAKFGVPTPPTTPYEVVRVPLQ